MDINSIITGLKQEFPSIDDQDAQKAAELLPKAEPVTQFQGTPQPTAENSMPHASPMEPQYIPEPGEDLERDKAVGEIERYASGRDEQAPTAGSDIGKYGWMQYFPRLQGVYAQKMKSASDQAALAADKQRSQLDTQKWLAEYRLKSGEESRKAAEFGQKQNEYTEGQKTGTPQQQVYVHLLSKMTPEQRDNLSKMPMSQLKDASDFVKGMWTEQNRQLESEARLDETRLAREQSGIQQTLNRNQSKEMADRAFSTNQDEKQAKKNEQMVEVADRKENILYNINKAIKMIEEDGTYELTGTHNQDLARRMSEIATDMAKIQDPRSTARQSEVDMVLENLVKPGFKNKNATALKLLESFKVDVEERAKRGYQNRGLLEPGAPGDGVKSGNFNSAEIVKREISKSTGKMKITRSDGSTEIIDAPR